MHKRSIAFGYPNSRKGYFNPQISPNIIEMMMILGGFKDGDFPIIQQQNATLEYTLPAGRTETRALTSRNGSWMLIGKMATIKGSNGRLFALPDLINVSSSVPNGDGESEIISEESPISLIFGTGEWQRSLFPVTWQAVNSRVYAVTNTSSFPVTVSLGFKLARMMPKVVW